jgi:hypothetical protein
MNATTQELTVLSRAASVTAQTLMALKKSIDGLIGDPDMDILIRDTETISPRQKEFLTTLIRKNFVDPGERENKLEELDSYSRSDADAMIKQLLPNQ